MTTARRSILHLSSFILLSLFAVSLFALDIPPAPTQWFTDRANVVPPTEADLLNAKLRQFEQDSGAQFIIYVFPSLEGEAMEDFTIRAVERWKVGQKKYDNGLALFVFVAEKKIRVEVAYGLEGTVTDAFSSRVIREQLAPPFQQGDYARGLNAAADAIITKIKTGEEPVPPLQPAGGQGESAQGEDIGIVPAIIILFVIFFVVLPMLRRGGCGGCMLPLFFSGGGTTFGGGGGFSGGGFGGGGGFSGGGGSFGGGGASGGW
jgi:uncharacterized protein